MCREKSYSPEHMWTMPEEVKTTGGHFCGGPVTPHSPRREALIPGQGTKSHMLQLKSYVIHVMNGEKLVLLESRKHQRQRNTDCQC